MLPGSRCKFCRVKFTPEEKARGFKLHPDCIGPFAEAFASRQARRKAAKARQLEAQSRRERRARKEELKTVSQWEKECREIVQKIARIRDRHDGCISCHMGPNYGGQWHGSHYRSVAACSALQFHLWNIHKACAQCNLHKGGNREGYRPRLIKKIGVDRVEWMDAQNGVTKRSGPAYIEYLKRFKKVMGKRLRRMERAAREAMEAA